MILTNSNLGGYAAKAVKGVGAYTAQITLDGKTVAYVEQSGRGGAPFIGTGEGARDFMAFAADLTGEENGYEMVVEALVQAVLNNRKRKAVVAVGRPPYPFDTAIRHADGSFRPSAIAYEISGDREHGLASLAVRHPGESFLVWDKTVSDWVKA